MKTYQRIQLDDWLEPVDMGHDQQEIAAWVMGDSRWVDYVGAVNAAGIPSEDGLTPTDEWEKAQTFHPDQLISEACEALGWDATPQTGGFELNFYDHKDYIIFRTTDIINKKES